MKIFGDYHMHTTYSDGKNSALEMARTAKEKELREIAITDHGFKKIWAGMRSRKFEKMHGEIESARAELPILFGVESNLTSTQGAIDVPEKHRDKFDIILFGVHVNVWYSPIAMFTFALPNLFWRLIHWTPKFQRRYNTKLVKRVIERNKIDIWTHPNRYFHVNTVEVAKSCTERGTLIELNGQGIAFRPIDFERMQEMGCKFIIGSDAHKSKRVAEFARVEEFLKNCDVDEKNIINLNMTFTEYKESQNARLSERNQSGDKTNPTGDGDKKRRR